MSLDYPGGALRDAHISAIVLVSLSAPGGGEGRGEVRDSGAFPREHDNGAATSPSPSPARWVPSLSPACAAERANFRRFRYQPRWANPVGTEPGNDEKWADT